MNHEEELQVDPTPTDSDIRLMLQYVGASLREHDQITDGVGLLDYRDTDDNERNISILLSSQGIRFHIERPKFGWSGTKIRMVVTVPRSQCLRAESILNAAAKASVVEVVAGLEGLSST